MKFPLTWLLIFGTWFCYNTITAQFYTSGTDPASIRWQQINTPHACIVFPKGFDSVANRIANIYDYIYLDASKSLVIKPRKITIVIHNQSTFSNGFVTLGPRRMELFTTPPQQNNALDWISDLTIHEFRHVAQTGKVNQGLTKAIYPVFGQLSSGLVSAMMPLWFAEGDAVYTETMLTNSGRGRTGEFTMAFKPLLTDNNKLFPFEKTLHGSYKHFIPSHYHSGYLMVSTIRAHYGKDVFAKSLSFMARNPYIPFSFSYSLKLQTGKTSRELYTEVFSNLKNQVNTNLSNYEDYNLHTNTIPAVFTNYRYPQPINDTAIITVKSGLGDVPQFIYLYKSGNEKIIFTPGNYRNTRFSHVNSIIAWSEEIPDLRWSNRNYSCIKIFNTHTGKQKRLSHKTRYFSAALSNKGKNVATIEVTLQNKSFLVILDSETGAIKERVPAPENLMLSEPAYSNNDSNIVVVASGFEGKTIYRYHMYSGTWEQAMPFSYHNISCPAEHNNQILFAADYTGNNNIFVYNLNTHNIHPITNIKFGAFEPCFQTKKSEIGFTQYTSHGYLPTIVPMETIFSNSIKPQSITDSLILSGTKAENFNFQDSVLKYPNILNHTYTVKPYRKIPHAINIHSWAPFYYDFNNIDFNNQQVYPGITLLSQNKLSNTISSLSYYNQNGIWKAQPRLIYKGWYPVIDISAEYGGPVPYYVWKNITAPPKNGFFSLNTLVYTPLNLSQNKYYTGITPFLELQFDNSRLYYTSDTAYHSGRLFSTLGIIAYSYHKTSLRDIAPKFGFYLTARYKLSPLNSSHFNYIAYINPRVYLPGMFRHHSLQIAGGLQHQDPEVYLFESMLNYPRGYVKGRTFKLYTLSADYAFPICYPDFNIGPIAYFKRIRTNLFFDVAQNRYIDYNSRNWVARNYQSMGIDWITDFHAFHIFFPFTAVFRTCYLPIEKTTINQFFINIDFRF